MKKGTEGFRPERLREAREARRQSVLSLSEVANVHKNAIYLYEKGESSPSSEVLTSLSKALNYPPEYFLWNRKQRAQLDLDWRSLSKAIIAARRSAVIKFGWILEIIDFQTEFITYPKVNLPIWNVQDPTQLTMRQIEQYALELRRFWKLGDGPIGNVAWLLEGNGILIASAYMDADGLDAASAWPEDSQWPIILAAKEITSAARMRFNLAHELAHILLHRNADRELLRTGTDYYKCIENQAHRFAGAFLFPESSFKSEAFFPNLDHYKELKRKWRISIAMMVKRAEHLGLMKSPEAKENLWRNYGRRGWKSLEPFDDELPVEEPHLLFDGFNTIIKHGIMSVDEICSALPLAKLDLEQLCGIGPGFFSAAPPTVELKSGATIVELGREVEFEEG